jgi:hypothetical protein
LAAAAAPAVLKILLEHNNTAAAMADRDALLNRIHELELRLALAEQNGGAAMAAGSGSQFAERVASALTSSQIVAGIFTIGLLVIQYFLGYVTVIWGENFRAAPLFHYISSQEHLHYFTKGLLDTRPLVYYLSVTLFLLFITYQVIDYRRWRR